MINMLVATKVKLSMERMAGKIAGGRQAMGGVVDRKSKQYTRI